jgi:hypothetical protein
MTDILEERLYQHHRLYDVQSAWFGRPEAPAEVANKYLGTLDRLEHAHALFNDWRTSLGGLDDPTLTVASLRPSFTEWVWKGAVRDDYGEPDPEDGYQLFAWAAAARETETEPGSRIVSFYARAGGRWDGSCEFKVGDYLFPPDPAFVTYPIYRDALLAMVAVWQPPWANAQCAIWGQRPTSPPALPPFPYSRFQMPWISYLSAERAAGVNPPNVVAIERTPDGGLLMTATEERFDPENAGHMRASLAIAEIMMAHAETKR